MQSAQPTELHSSRVFFTQLDRVTYSQVAWKPDDVDRIRESLAAKLKLLLLTKGHVVVPASHLLESELARELVLENPQLIESRALVPALRQDYPNCQAFLDAKIGDKDRGEADLYVGTQQQEIARLTDASGLVVRWNPGDTSEWFRSRLLADVEDEGSLLRSCIRAQGEILGPDVAAQLRAAPRFTRGTVYHIAKAAGGSRAGELLSTYADFLYYLSGARAVDSAGVLPQENLVDFSITDLAGGHTSLSDHDVFFKIFIDIVKAETSTHFPVDLLNALSVTDALDLHHVALESRFTQKYEGIQANTKAALGVRDPERLVLLLEEIAAYERELQHEFHAAIEREMTPRLRAKLAQRAGTFLQALASLLLTPVGFITGARDVAVSGLRLLGKQDVLADTERRFKGGLGALAQMLERRPPSERPILLMFVERMKVAYASRMGVGS